MKPATRIPFAVLASVPFVMVLSNSMLIPVLPALQRGLGITLFQAGLIITAFSITAGLVIPAAGVCSDYWGRKNVMVPALFLFGLGGLLAGLAPLFSTAGAYPWIIAGRIVQGVGGGGTYQVALALAGDIFQSQERSKVMGLLEASNGLGKVISPILGAALGILTWYTPFFAYPVLAWASAAGVWFFVQEPRQREEPQDLPTYWRNLLQIFARQGRLLVAAFVAGMVALFALFGVLSWFSDILETNHNITGLVKGLIIAIPVLVSAITAWLVGTTLQTHLNRYMRAVVVGGLAMGGLALIALLFIDSLGLTTAALVVLGLGNGLVLPTLNTAVTSSAGGAMRGLVTALYGTVRFFGAALGPPFFGLVDRMGFVLTFLLAAGLMLACGLLAFFWVQKEPGLSPAAAKARQAREKRAPKVFPVPPKIRLGGGEDDEP